MASASASASGPEDRGEDPVEILKNTPTRSILKPTGGRAENHKRNKNTRKSTKWDEMNILNTLHPLDKDYGYMKIGEPKTPYEQEINEYDDGVNVRVNAEELKERIENIGVRSSSFQSISSKDGSSEQKISREAFEEKRRKHYNEFQTAQKLEKQMAEEEDEDDDDYEKGKV